MMFGQCKCKDPLIVDASDLCQKCRLIFCGHAAIREKKAAATISTALNHFQGQSIDGPDDVQAITEAIVKTLKDNNFFRN